MAKQKDAFDDILDNLEDDLLIEEAGADEQPAVSIVKPVNVKPVDIKPVEAEKVQVVKRTSVQSNDPDKIDGVMASMLDKIKGEFETISADVLGQWKADRDQIQQVIDLFIESVGDDPNTAARPIVEGLVELLNTKVNSSMTAIKLLEVKTKLLMAIKSTSSVVINNQNAVAGGQNSELTDLLSGPEESDFS